MAKTIPPQIIRQVFITLLLLLMGGLIFRELLPYLTGVLGAITLFVLMRKWMATLVNKKKWNPYLAVAVLMFGSFIGILLPISGTILMLGNKIGDAVENSTEVMHVLKDQLYGLEQKFGYDLTSQIDPSAI